MMVTSSSSLSLLLLLSLMYIFPTLMFALSSFIIVTIQFFKCRLVDYSKLIIMRYYLLSFWYLCIYFLLSSNSSGSLMWIHSLQFFSFCACLILLLMNMFIWFYYLSINSTIFWYFFSYDSMNIVVYFF